ncbi:MAG TPA: type II toxin-antitoxin system HicB family antitoxin [Thermomicrobiales bacterium]|nr:type II toxin-antitoxin system HicB family antitoxin [Thermomicrobiales bacterium]
MLAEYITAAMRHVVCEQLDDGSTDCKIPELPGVWSNADSEGEARTEIQDVLEAWIALGLALNEPLPAIDGIEIAVQGVRSCLLPGREPEWRTRDPSFVGMTKVGALQSGPDLRLGPVRWLS